VSKVTGDSAYLGRDGYRRLLQFTESGQPLPERVVRLLLPVCCISTTSFWRLIERTIDVEKIARSSVGLKIAATECGDFMCDIFTSNAKSSSSSASIFSF